MEETRDSDVTPSSHVDVPRRGAQGWLAVRLDPEPRGHCLPSISGWGRPRMTRPGPQTPERTSAPPETQGRPVGGSTKGYKFPAWTGFRHNTIFQSARQNSGADELRSLICLCPGRFMKGDLPSLLFNGCLELSASEAAPARPGQTSDTPRFSTNILRCSQVPL